MPPNQISMGCCTGRGRTRAPSYRKNSPSWSTASSVQNRRRRGSASSKRVARSVRSTPKACCSPGSTWPSPNAGSRRPDDSRSRLASSLASSIGLRPGSTITLVPSLSFVVRAAANDRATTGSGQSSVIFSDSHSESNRRASRASTSAPNRSASFVIVRVPSP